MNKLLLVGFFVLILSINCQSPDANADPDIPVNITNVTLTGDNTTIPADNTTIPADNTTTTTTTNTTNTTTIPPITTTSSVQCEEKMECSDWYRSTPLLIHGHAFVEVPDELLFITLVRESQEYQPSICYTNGNQTVQRAYDALVQLGLPAEELIRGHFSIKRGLGTFQATTGSFLNTTLNNTDGETQIPNVSDTTFTREFWYRCQNRLVIKTTRFDLLSQIIDTAGQNGLYIESFFFDAKEETKKQLRDSLVQKAFEDARARANLLVGPMGMRILKVKSVEFPVGGWLVRDTPDYFGGTETVFFHGKRSISLVLHVSFLVDSTNTTSV